MVVRLAAQTMRGQLASKRFLSSRVEVTLKVVVLRIHVKLLRLGTSRSPVDISLARRDPDGQLLLQQLLVFESLIS